MRTSPSTLGAALLSGLLLAAPARSQSNSDAWRAPEHAGHAAGQHGAQGLLEVGSARLGRPGILRLGVLGEHGWASDYPDAVGDHRRTVGTFAASYVPLSWLEVAISWAAASNLNTGLSPSPINAMGDLTLGAKVATDLTPWLAGGLELTGLLFPGVVAASNGPAAFGAAPRALLSADFQRLEATLPLRAHLNLGGRFDTTGDLVGYGLSAAEEVALSVNRYPRLTYGLGVEVPLAWITPFAEHAMALPLGVEAPADPADAPSGLRHTLAAGVRVTAIRDLSLTLAGQVALQRDVLPGIAASMPFNLFFGASFNLDTLGGAPAPAPAIAPAAGPVMHRLSGVVRDHRTGAPIPGAVVSFVGSKAPPVATDATSGAFLTHAVAEGRVQLNVEKAGYHPLTVALPSEADAAPATLVLTPKVLPAKLLIDVRSGSGNRPLAAEIALTGTERRTLVVPASGALPVELSAGTYTLQIRAEGHLAQVRDLQVSEGGTLPVAFELAEAPKKALVVFKKDQLEILQQVRFGAGTAALHPDSIELLRQVVDAVVRNDVKRLRIEGHTDSQGAAKVNLRLSKDRAQAVADALVELGLDRSRLDVEGHGSTRPLAPNVTARGRQLNRRVDFIVVDQER